LGPVQRRKNIRWRQRLRLIAKNLAHWRSSIASVARWFQISSRRWLA
jgi:hypothetical protein